VKSDAPFSPRKGHDSTAPNELRWPDVLRSFPAELDQALRKDPTLVA
jgi:hypothetical protein